MEASPEKNLVPPPRTCHKANRKDEPFPLNHKPPSHGSGCRQPGQARCLILDVSLRRMSAFDDTQFSEIYPVSFIMRNNLPNNWFRIHSLPESKRYPESETEWDMLIQRHRAISGKVLVEGGKCRIHYSLFDDSGFPKELTPSLNWSCARLQRYGDDQMIYIQSAEANWSFDAFSPWIRRRSEDELGWISFHALDTDAIYSPYDGGADIFSMNPTFLARIRSSFSAWKSPHPTGT